MRRPRVALYVAVASLACVAIASACGGEEDNTPRLADAGSDASLLGDSAPPLPDAAPPPGEPCGTPGGEEPGAPWPVLGGCPKRANVTVTFVGPRTTDVKWTYAAAIGSQGAVVSAARAAWIGTADGTLVSLTGGGALRAEMKVGARITGAPALAQGGVVVVGTDEGVVGVTLAQASGDAGVDAAVDAGDSGADDAGDAAAEGGASVPARVVWRLPIGAVTSSPALGRDGTIYVTTAAGALHAIASDGSRSIFTAPTGDTTGLSPAIATNGTIYCGSSDGRLYAFSPAGALVWSLPLGAPVTAAPVVGGDETVYVGTSDGRLHAVAPDRAVRFTYAAGGALRGAAAVLRGTVYVSSDDKGVHAVDTQTGKPLWTYFTGGTPTSPLVGRDGTVYAAATDARLYAIAPSGLLSWAQNVRARARGSLALSDEGTLYVAGETGLVAVGP